MESGIIYVLNIGMKHIDTSYAFVCRSSRKLNPKYTSF
jgi:hypothetical protein